MFEKLSEALRLLGANFYVMFGIVISLWLPFNLFIDWIDREYIDPNNFAASFQLYSWSSSLLLPLSDAALLSALAVYKQDIRPTYLSSLATGFRLWLAMFATYFVVNLISGLALLLLIVPGVILYLRYALVGPVVAVEGLSVSAAMNRSKQLTNGRKWWLLGCFTLLTMFIFVLGLTTALLSDVLAEFVAMPEPVTFVLNALGSIVFDLGTSFITVFLFVCYCDFSGVQFLTADSEEDTELTPTQAAAWEALAEEMPEHPNPYRSPEPDE